MRIRTWKNCGITSSACQRFSPLPPSWLDLLCKAYCPVNFFNLYIGNLQSLKVFLLTKKSSGHLCPQTSCTGQAQGTAGEEETGLWREILG